MIFPGRRNNTYDLSQQQAQAQAQAQAQSQAQHRGQMIDPNNPNASALQNDINKMPNPFNNPLYSNNLPDIPLQDPGAAMLNALLNDDAVPEKIKQEFWWVFHRDNVLTFLDEGRKISKLLNFDILKIDMLNNTPYYEYTFEKEAQWNGARGMFETKLDRSLGMNGKNERLTIPLTVTENITRQVGGEQEGQVKQGFLKRILNRK